MRKRHLELRLPEESFFAWRHDTMREVEASQKVCFLFVAK
jgi:hypothetical protein